MLRGVETAIAVARLGYPVFPLSSNKAPAVEKGTDWKDVATRDPDKIRQAWARRPRSGIGIRRPLVIDLDVKKKGINGVLAWFDWSADHNVDLPTTSPTPSGGGHVYTKCPEGVALPGNSTGLLPAGMDVRGPDTGYAAVYQMPPPYDELPEAPEALLQALSQREADERLAEGPTTPWMSKAYAEAGIEGELARLDYEKEKKWEGEGWDETTYQVACNLIEILNSWLDPALDRAALQQKFFDRAPDDGGKFSRHKHQEKWDSAEQKVGDKIRRNPDGDSPFDVYNPAPVTGTPETAAAALAEAHKVFAQWLGDDYDLDALDATLAAAAVERLDGDPLWLLLISGSGNAKTETVQALDGIGASVVSTISSEGAMLSATSARDIKAGASGGLLRQMGSRGLLVIKDVTSILSMSRDQRGQVLGALREVYDGRWARSVGTDGGRTLSWAGRIVLVGAVTTAWDTAHAVIATMGDRFVLLRMDSTTGRQAAGRKAIGNTGSEVQMRAELAQAVADVLAAMTTPAPVTDDETEQLLAAADLVTRARTGVEYDYRGDVIDSHAPEMPTRFAKQLAQLLRGGNAVGLERGAALRLAIRGARDSMPPLRLLVVDDLATHPGASTAEVRKRLGKPRATVDKQLQALHMLGVLDVTETEIEWSGQPGHRWYYRLADGIDPGALAISTGSGGR